MKYFSNSLLVAGLCLVASLSLSGCSGFDGASFPDAAANPTAANIADIQGNNFGGHAPIIGAHVFVLEANPASTGYGQLVKSLLTSSSANAGFPTALDTTQGSPTSGMYFVTTNNNGQFFLSGDYSCDLGSPVYLYASGGNPSAPYPTQNLTVTAASISGTGPYTIALTDSSLVYQGETVTFTGSGSNLAKFLNGTTQTVLGDANLTANSFDISVPSLTNNGVTLIAGTQSPIGTLTGVQATAPSNGAIANMALLGVCGDTSPTNAAPTTTANFSGLNFVYMNEVSTVAAAEAMAGFFQVPTYAFTVTVGSLTHNGITVSPGAVSALGALTATDTTSGTTYTITGATISNTGYTVTMSASAPITNGHNLTFSSSSGSGTFGGYISGAILAVTSSYTTSDALHISVPAGHASATTGLQNAARNAALLYDIQGIGNIGNNNGNGDARIARSVTPANANGVVPQMLLDTLGNILANCVDSANLYGVNSTGAVESPQCSTLFGNATSDGTTTGLKPYDIATAAVNIAKHPAGEPTTNSTFIANLFNSPTGNVPFVPNLSTKPNDFSVGISYSGNGLYNVTGVAIDASGDAWFTAGGFVVELGPQGSPISGSGYSTGNGNTLDTTPAIDLSGNIWFVNNGYGVFKMNSSGVLQSTGLGYDTQSAYPRGIAIDANNNVWVNNYYGDSIGIGVTELSQAGAILKNVDINPTRGGTTGPTVLRNTLGIAMDGSGLIWVDGYSTENVASINTISYAVNWYNNSGSQAADGPRYLAIDQAGQIWLPNYYLGLTPGAGNYLSTVVPSSATASGTANSYNFPYGYYTGGGLNGNNQISIDGANNIWVSGAGNYISEFSNSGVPQTPSTGYSGGFSTATPTGLGYSAVDLSGNLWIATPTANSVVQMIGVATPVLTPIVAAAKAGTPASKP